MTASQKFDLMSPDLPDDIKENAISSGNYPYEKRMNRKKYQRELLALQIELRKLQAHIRNNGLRVAILFEGRDAAGKGSTIKRFMQHLNPRHAHIIALSKPTETERGQWYFQRYTAHLPTAGDMSFFDRSWYNRAGVEPVMGFCTAAQTAHFLVEAPAFEKMLVRDNIHLFKYWLTIGREMQLKRFHDRQHNPLKRWKISPIDLKAIDKWDDYSKAKSNMLRQTHTIEAPWTIIRANDKRRARLNAIRHILTNIDYAEKDEEIVGATDPNILGQGPDFDQT